MPRILAGILSSLLLLSARPAQAQGEPSVGRELLGNEMNPALSIILDTVGSYASEAKRVPLGGHAPTANGVAITGAELTASASVDTYFRFDAAFSMTDLELEEITFTTLALPGNLQVRGGKFLARLGRHNATHAHAWRFVLHPLPSQYLFGAEGLGAPGLEVSWLAPLPWYTELVGAVQVGGRGSFLETEGDASGKDLVTPLRLVQFFDLSDDWALQVGLNAVQGPSALAPGVGNRAYAYGFDLFVKWRPIGFGETGYSFVAWTTEAWARELEAPLDRWRDVGGTSDLVVGLDKRWETALRGELWRRVEGADPTEANQRAAFGLDTERGSVALTFLPSHFSRVRLQYTLEHVEGYAVNHLALVQVEVSAGAHGAHTY